MGKVITAFFCMMLFASGIPAQEYNMGSDATQGDYGWFNGNVTTIDLNPGAEAPFDGTMVQWRLNNAFMGGTAVMKVFRDSADTYLLVAEDSRTISPNSGLNTFTVDIPVEQGDLLGIYVSDYDLVMCTTGGALVLHNGNTGTSLKTDWTGEGFTLAVDALVQPTGVQEEELHSIRSLKGWPNPSGPGFRIAFHLQKSAQATLNIYDITGREVRTLSLPPAYSSPPTVVIWDGRDNRGKPVPDGVYFYRLRSGNEAVTRSMIFLR